ncbi:MAG: acyl-CoA thioesterase [Thermoguttaceae bacterium]
MPAVFEWEHTVEDAEIDGQDHANNVVYVEWLQAAAVAHSAAQGWPGSRYRQVGFGWVVRRHTIEYLQPAHAGDRIVVRTWVSTMKRVSSVRQYEVLRPSDRVVLAKAETLWAFIDYAARQPRRILPEVAGAFELVETPPGP